MCTSLFGYCWETGSFLIAHATTVAICIPGGAAALSPERIVPFPGGGEDKTRSRHNGRKMNKITTQQRRTIITNEGGSFLVFSVAAAAPKIARLFDHDEWHNADTEGVGGLRAFLFSLADRTSNTDVDCGSRQAACNLFLSVPK